MAIKPGLNNLLWMAAGALILLAFVLLVLHFHNEQDPAAQIAFKARRVELVTRMRLNLASAGEAEKSAVMATTDKDSQTFADQAHAHAAAVDRGRNELDHLLQTGGTQTEKDLLASFSEAFAELQRVDKDLLELAVQNTNLKAYRLAYGPAADALKEMDAALSRIVTASAASPDAKQVMQIADACRIGALRIQALLPPHIAEESEKKMDELEAQVAKEDSEVRKGLQSLAALLKSGGSADIESAAAHYAKFGEIKAEIFKLSRANTNVRSLDISLNRKRRVMLKCQNILADLEQSIQQEPIPGAAGTVVHPR